MCAASFAVAEEVECIEERLVMGPASLYEGFPVEGLQDLRASVR